MEELMPRLSFRIATLVEPFALALVNLITRLGHQITGFVPAISYLLSRLAPHVDAMQEVPAEAIAGEQLRMSNESRHFGFNGSIDMVVDGMEGRLAGFEVPRLFFKLGKHLDVVEQTCQEPYTAARCLTDGVYDIQYVLRAWDGRRDLPPTLPFSWPS